VSTSGFARSGLIAVFAGFMLSSIGSSPFQAIAAASSGVKLHSKAPDFTLMDDAGKPFKLSDHLGKGKVVLFFYMSDKATNCTDEICCFRDDYEKFREKGADVIGISPDTVKDQAEFKKEHNVQFALLSDPGSKVTSRWILDGDNLPPKTRRTFILDEKGIIKKAFTAKDEEVKQIVSKTLSGLDVFSGGGPVVSP
jgi:thioredoxin-dependent peroxiredoxin